MLAAPATGSKTLWLVDDITASPPAGALAA